MTKRAWTVVLALGLCLSTQGCGDDDGEDDGDSGSGGSSDSGRGGSGNAGRGGSGNAGTGNAGTGNSGSGSSNPIADCMAEEMMGMTTQDCEGIEEYSECVQDMCLNDCNDDCSAYYDCVQDADDPCMPTGCQPSSACTNCLTGATGCFADCIDLIMCGETMSGGACDQLDDCCATSSMPDVCEQLASAARAGGGDMACEAAMDAFCM